MLSRIEEFIRTRDLFTTDDRVLVGFSGGADSTCLLHILHRLEFDCVAAYLHHGQRDDADAELEHCRAFAESLGVPFLSGKADVPELSRLMKVGLEEAGREARYEFFTRAAGEMDCQVIATAHTASDQLETVLLNLTRGTGLKGLRGIPSERGNIVRPLLPLTRAETEEYCRSQGVGFTHDSANDDESYSRVKIRNHVVPTLLEINPNLLNSIIRSTETIAEEDQFLDGMAAAGLEKSELVPNPDLAFLTNHLEFFIDRQKIEALPPVLFKRSIILGSKSLGGHFEQRHVEIVMEGIKHDRSGSVTSPDEAVSVTWNETTLHFAKAEPILPFRTALAEGVLESEEMRWQLSLRMEKGSSSLPSRRSLHANLPVSKVKMPLLARNIQEGDRMTPIGFTSERKVSDLVAEAKVTRLARPRLPVVCDVIGPIWIPGVCLDARMSHQNRTDQVMSVTFGPL